MNPVSLTGSNRSDKCPSSCSGDKPVFHKFSSWDTNVPSFVTPQFEHKKVLRVLLNYSLCTGRVCLKIPEIGANLARMNCACILCICFSDATPLLESAKVLILNIRIEDHNGQSGIRGTRPQPNNRNVWNRNLRSRHGTTVIHLPTGPATTMGGTKGEEV